VILKALAARDQQEHQRPVATPNEGAASTAWPFPPGANVARQRKPPVKVAQDAILAWMHERLSATPREIAQHFNISTHSARCKADGLVAQGKLNVTPGSLSPPTPRRYSVPAACSPPESSGTTAA
jgi:hypothetical protein